MISIALKQRILAFPYKYRYGAKNWRIERAIALQLGAVNEQLNEALVPFLFDIVCPETIARMQHAVSTIPVISELRVEFPEFLTEVDLNTGQFII